jgi:hypothetical protein
MRCPVYAPRTMWKELQYYPIKDRHVIKDRTPGIVARWFIRPTRQSMDRSLAGSDATNMAP